MVSRRLYLWTAIVVAALTAWLFGPAISGQQSFLFRDAAHYYGPLFAWNVQQWRAGSVPLWNPLEHLGLPALGETTASVLYPGQLLLLAPIDFLWAYNLYIVAHAPLAAYGAWRLARRFGCSGLAAGQAALAYAFSGAVMFQYCNVAMLVGAAWLPPACEAIDRLLGGGGRWKALGRTIGLAVCLAMMALGGDPQMAYHVALAGLLYAALLSRPRTVEPAVANRVPPPFRRQFARHATRLSAAGALAALLAAAQILPAWELASQSPRARADGPRSVWECPAWAARSLAPARLLAPASPPADAKLAVANANPPDATPRAGGPSALWDASSGGFHLERAYRYSVGAWRWFELAWPNFGGRQFPTHRRWLSAWDGANGLWTPSLYAGALLLPLAYGGARGGRWRAGETRWRWMRWLALGSALAALGVYGVGWMLGGLAEGITGRPLPIGPEVGGVYWLMNVLLPGYVAFRYPAKLWTITALALAMLSARGWDAATSGEDSRAPKRMAWFGLAGLVGAAVVFAARPWLMEWFATGPAEPLFGPLDASGAVADLASGFFQGGFVCLVGGWLLRRRWREEGPNASWTCAVLLALTAIDLGIAHRWLAPCADIAAWQPKPLFAPPPAGAGQLARLYRDEHWLPGAWSESGSPNRLRQMFAWDRNTLWPKYHLPLGVRSVVSSGVMLPDEYLAFWEVARLHGEGPGAPTRPDGAILPARSLLDLAGAEFLILPAGAKYDETQPLFSTPSVADAALWQNDHALPRAWIVHAVEHMPWLADRRPAAIRARTERVLFTAGQPRDWRREAVVETDSSSDVLKQLSGEGRETEYAANAASIASEPEWCWLQVSSPDEVVIRARLARPGLVVLGDLFYPGWTAIVREGAAARQAEILRTDRVLRGVALPAGEFQIDFRYEPRLFRIGAAISGLTWAGVVAMLAARVLRRREALALLSARLVRWRRRIPGVARSGAGG